MRNVRPERYRKVVFITGLALAAIVLTGAAVRLTEAGLGCENWPSCTEDRFVPEWGLHPWIEFGNRLISGVVAAAAAVAVLSAYRRSPRRADLIRWAWGLVAGVLAQVVLGGITVLVDLHPVFVGIHFLLSMVLLWNAAVLWVRAGAGGARSEPAVERGLINHSRALVALAGIVLISGTIVTGTGPNSGDSRAERLGFDLVDVTRSHSVLVWCFLAVTAGFVLRLSRSNNRAPRASRIVTWLLVAILAQAGVGYAQYATGVPPALVEIHVLGAIVVWVLAVLVHLGLFHRPEPESGDDIETIRADGVNTALVLDKMSS